MIVQDQHASLTQPDHSHFANLRGESPLASVDRTRFLSWSDGCEKRIGEVVVKIDRCLIDPDYDDCIQKLWDL